MPGARPAGVAGGGTPLSEATSEGAGAGVAGTEEALAHSPDDPDAAAAHNGEQTLLTACYLIPTTYGVLLATYYSCE